MWTHLKEKKTATIALQYKLIPSSVLAWEIPWTEGPGGLQSMGSRRVRHNLVTKQQQQSLGLWHTYNCETKRNL